MSTMPKRMPSEQIKAAPKNYEYERRRHFIGTEQLANEYIIRLDKHYVLKVFFKDEETDAMRFPKEAWDVITRLMNIPRKYSLSNLTFGCSFNSAQNFENFFGGGQKKKGGDIFESALNVNEKQSDNAKINKEEFMKAKEYFKNI
jgi:hypothetical protein